MENKTVKKFYICSPSLKRRRLISHVTSQNEAKLAGLKIAKNLKLSLYSIVSETITSSIVTKMIYEKRIYS